MPSLVGSLKDISDYLEGAYEGEKNNDGIKTYDLIETEEGYKIIESEEADIKENYDQNY